MRRILPELPLRDNNGFLTINGMSVIPLLRECALLLPLLLHCPSASSSSVDWAEKDDDNSLGAKGIAGSIGSTLCADDCTPWYWSSASPPAAPKANPLSVRSIDPERRRRIDCSQARPPVFPAASGPALAPRPPEAEEESSPFSRGDTPLLSACRLSGEAGMLPAAPSGVKPLPGAGSSSSTTSRQRKTGARAFVEKEKHSSIQTE